jgi:cytochrome c
MSYRTRLRVVLVIAGSLVSVPGMRSQAAAPDLERGALLFQTCTACHSVLGDGVGPDLRGIYGKKAAARSGFNYSAALKSSDIVWDEANLRAFVTDPQALVKGTAMTFPGYPTQSDIDAVIAYLKTFN